MKASLTVVSAILLGTTLLAAPQTFSPDAEGFIRNWLREHLDLRVTPSLDFRPDRSMQHAANIQVLLKQLGSGNE